MRPFKVGDRVTIADTTGDVLEKTLLVTKILTIKNVDVTIPNSMILNSHILNFSTMAKERGLIIHSTVTIGYDSPWRQVHALLTEAAEKTPLVQAQPPPYVLQTGLDDFYVSYQINAFTKAASSMAVTQAQLHQNIQDVFNAGGRRDYVATLHLTTRRE